MPSGLLDEDDAPEISGVSPPLVKSGITYAAEISECRQYRYWLSRNWSMWQLSDGRCGPWALWIGMNPSTADGYSDDPTVRREMAFTKSFGVDVYVKVNVMDYRSTTPVKLLEAGVQPRSDRNLQVIKELAERAGVIIACWGALHASLRCYADDVVALLADKKLMCLGTTADGSPRHPLYVAGKTPLVPYQHVGS